MLNIQIDDPLLEADDSVATAFAEFVATQKIKQDVIAAENEFKNGQFSTASDVFQRIRAKYQ